MRILVAEDDHVIAEFVAQGLREAGYAVDVASPAGSTTGNMRLPFDAGSREYRLQGVVRSGLDGMEVEVVGGKFNLTDVAARVGLGQLPRLEEFNARRRELVRRYFELLDTPELRELGLGLPPADFTGTNWHMFQVALPLERLTLDRAGVMAALQAAGIGSGVHYPPIHLFAVYRRLGWKAGDFPLAERLGRALLTLPLFPAMVPADVERVAGELTTILRTHRR
jgi:dTDP-4-amino-4,6-dideoxygalactose transaminase